MDSAATIRPPRQPYMAAVAKLQRGTRETHTGIYFAFENTLMFACRITNSSTAVSKPLLTLKSSSCVQRYFMLPVPLNYVFGLNYYYYHQLPPIIKKPGI